MEKAARRRYTLEYKREAVRLVTSGHEVWIGDAAQIRADYVRKQKADKSDAGHILKLLVADRFPRLRVPDAVMRDQRQVLIHRHKLVQIRTKGKDEYDRPGMA